MADEPRKSIRELFAELGGQFDERLGSLSAILPKGVTPERIKETVLTECVKNPTLLMCDRNSLFESVRAACQMGLEFVDGQAFLIPYWNKDKNTYICQLQVGYKGWVKLIWSSGLVDGVEAECVHENDGWEEHRGTKSEIIHTINRRANRGARQFSYARVRLKGSSEPMLYVCDAEEIARAKKASQKGSFAWQADNERWGYLKTALKRIAKLLPKTPQLQLASEVDDVEEILQGVELSPEGAQASADAKLNNRAAEVADRIRLKRVQNESVVIGSNGEPEYVPVIAE